MALLNFKIGEVIINTNEICINTPPTTAKHDLLISFFFTDSIIIKSKHMDATLTTVEQISGQLTPTNKKGQPTPIEAGTVEYSSDNEAVVTVEEDAADETKFKIVAKGEGAATVSFSADADRGEGVVTIVGTINVTVLPSAATGFGVTLDPPTEQP